VQLLRHEDNPNPKSLEAELMAEHRFQLFIVNARRTPTMLIEPKKGAVTPGGPDAVVDEAVPAVEIDEEEARAKSKAMIPVFKAEDALLDFCSWLGLSEQLNELMRKHGKHADTEGLLSQLFAGSRDMVSVLRSTFENGCVIGFVLARIKVKHVTHPKTGAVEAQNTLEIFRCFLSPEAWSMFVKVDTIGKKAKAKQKELDVGTLTVGMLEEMPRMFAADYNCKEIVVLRPFGVENEKTYSELYKRVFPARLGYEKATIRGLYRRDL
jgi:hypothetical protein